LAYVLLGATYSVMAIDGFSRPTECWPVADRYLKKAVELDPGVPDARFLAADQEFFFNWNFDRAEQIWQGIVADSRVVVDPDWYRVRALRFWALGRPDQALDAIRFARQLDPVQIALRIAEGDYLLHSNQLDAAIAKYQEVIRDSVSDPRAYFGLSEAYFLQRRFDDALDARREAARIVDDPALDEVLLKARGEAGFREVEREAARLQIGDLTVRAKSGGYVSPLDFARAFAQIAEVEQAFKYFEPAFADRAPALLFLNVDRSWDGVRKDSRFVKAVKRVGLPVVSSPS
ncbi:MAG: tetratricopeptide repeat protein, partial [Acidobacteriota bacterium]